jgi:hypothetical protein
MMRLLALLFLLVGQHAVAGQGFLMAFEGDVHRVIRVLGTSAPAEGQTAAVLPTVLTQASAVIPHGLMEVRVVRNQGPDSETVTLTDPRIVRAPLVSGVGHDRLLKGSGSHLLSIDEVGDVARLEITLSEAP